MKAVRLIFIMLTVLYLTSCGKSRKYTDEERDAETEKGRVLIEAWLSSSHPGSVITEIGMKPGNDGSLSHVTEAAVKTEEKIFTVYADSESGQLFSSYEYDDAPAASIIRKKLAEKLSETDFPYEIAVTSRTQDIRIGAVRLRNVLPVAGSEEEMLALLEEHMNRTGYGPFHVYYSSSRSGEFPEQVLHDLICESGEAGETYQVSNVSEANFLLLRNTGVIMADNQFTEKEHYDITAPSGNAAYQSSYYRNKTVRENGVNVLYREETREYGQESVKAKCPVTFSGDEIHYDNYGSGCPEAMIFFTEKPQFRKINCTITEKGHEEGPFQLTVYEIPDNVWSVRTTGGVYEDGFYLRYTTTVRIYP